MRDHLRQVESPGSYAVQSCQRESNPEKSRPEETLEISKRLLKEEFYLISGNQWMTTALKEKIPAHLKELSNNLNCLKRKWTLLENSSLSPEIKNIALESFWLWKND